MVAANETKTPTVAYAPFKTFLSAIETLGQGVPSNINRTVWSSFSGAMVSQIIGAFRFLGLIDQNGTPTDDLHQLIEDEPHRKELLRKIIAKSYAPLAKHDLAKMDLRSLQSAFAEYDVTGETLKKAITFFLQLARYADVKLSAYVLQGTRATSSRKRRLSVVRNGQTVDGDENKQDAPIWSGPSKSITLDGKITLTLKTSADTFQMKSEDRAFVLKLLAEIEEYEALAKDKELNGF